LCLARRGREQGAISSPHPPCPIRSVPWTSEPHADLACVQHKLSLTEAWNKGKAVSHRGSCLVEVVASVHLSNLERQPIMSVMPNVETIERQLHPFGG
jgi:hypothetical protein